MHEPRPYGLHAVGGEITQDDSASVELLARRLTNLKQLSGVDSLRMVRTLPDGGYVIAQDAGGVFRCIVHKPEPPPPPPPFDGYAKDFIPTLFSGAITSAIVRQGEGVGMLLSEGTRRRLANYNPENLPAKQQALQRFRIDYNTQFSELKPQVETAFLYTQYAAQRPTWYSGAMGEVMQIVGGYGRQVMAELPDQPIERARILIPPEVMAAIREQMGNVRLPGYTGLPNKDGKFQYDYKFNNTNAVAFDTENKPWLIRVAPSGVWAMPMPLVPATTTEAFRKYMEDKGDQEVIDILDRFGGMPSGEGFPLGSGGAFEAWRRAGVVIKVCAVADFYDHIAYSTACGWSFNSKGTEGYNTCYDYYDEEGLGYGLAYKIKLSLNAATANGKLPPALQPENPEDVARLNTYMAALFTLLKDDDGRHLAIKYKLRRVEASAILARIGGEVGQNELNYWDGLELAPIAAHGGSVSEVGRGYLYNGARFAFQPQIKYPEPFMGGCVSHDFLPLENGRNKDSYPNSDTIMFGYYIGDSLRVVKYFRDGRDYQKQIESDYEDCMTVGSWTQTETTGATSLVGNFYTSEIDERQSLAPIVKVTRIVGKDLGYDHTPFFSFDAPFWRPGSIWRNRYFSRQVNTEQSEGRSLAVAICIPYLCRNAVLHAQKESTTGSRKTESLGLSSVTDPTSYRYWTHDNIFHWNGGLDIMDGRPYPKDGNPVWVEIEQYAPYPCSDFADQGSWIPGLPADYTWLVHPKSNEWLMGGGGGAPKLQARSSSTEGPSTAKGKLQISILDGPDSVHNSIPDTMYFMGSPDDAVGVFYRDASKALFGSSTYANVMEFEGESRKRWGFSSLADNRRAHHFIGVINE